MIVVSDTSPILNLARIGRLQLLPTLYNRVLIPDAVFEELTAFSHDVPAHIDPGEAEAIVLAIERDADLLLMDERRGRRIATAAGVPITGLLGLIVRAKRAGLIDSGEPMLDDLIQAARFWIGPELYSEFLAEVDEA